MPTTRVARPILYEEYLAIEASSGTKHEWVDGVVYAMSGGTLAHNQLGAQLIGELLRIVGDRPCRVFTSDQRTRPRKVRFATYPDVTVVCGEPQRGATSCTASRAGRTRTDRSTRRGGA